MNKTNNNIFLDEDTVISYNVIEENEIINFIILTKNIKTLKKIILDITDLQKKYEHKIFNVFISSNYGNLQKL